MTDFIVVGAGSAGAVVASRLSADPSIRVTLLEAGGPKRPTEAVIPAAFSKLFETTADWNYRTEPQAALEGRRLYWPRGKMLGGSSAMNAMIWTRGARGDFDEWARLGNRGWGYDELAPDFAAAERPGDGGGITVSRLRTVNPVTRALVDAAIATGIAPNDGFEGGQLDGAGLFRVSQRRGRRCSTAVGYLDPARSRRNLTISPNSLVTEILVESGRAVGVRYRDAGGAAQVLRGRVVVAAGAIGSPALLLRSGIGPAGDLERARIPVVRDLPGVGRNLQDHLVIGTMYHCLEPVTLATAERLRHLAEYLVLGRGPLTSNVAEGGAFVRIDPDADRPDLELIFAPSFFVDHGRGNPPGHGYTIAVILQRPFSRGTLRLGEAPDAAPVIDANYLAHPDDLRRLVAGLELAERIGARPELARFRGERVFPEANVDSARFVRQRAETLYHPVGTCRMGSDSEAVVSDRLAVHGITDLWVADASVMPTITTGHPNAAVIAIGERAARICGSDAR